MRTTSAKSASESFGAGFIRRLCCVHSCQAEIWTCHGASTTARHFCLADVAAMVRPQLPSRNGASITARQKSGPATVRPQLPGRNAWQFRLTWCVHNCQAEIWTCHGASTAARQKCLAVAAGMVRPQVPGRNAWQLWLAWCVHKCQTEIWTSHGASATARQKCLLVVAGMVRPRLPGRNLDSPPWR